MIGFVIIMPSNVCILCKKQDSALSLQCDGCEKFLHLNCINIDADDATRITRQRTKGVKFFCSSCNRSVDQFSELKSILKSIESRLDKLENKPEDLAPATVENIVREVKHRIQRENNVIIYGLEESDAVSDSVAVNELFQSIKPDISSVIEENDVMRIGKKSNAKPRPVRAIFGNAFLVRDVIKNKHI